jgi:hypothetical protein
VDAWLPSFRSLSKRSKTIQDRSGRIGRLTETMACTSRVRWALLGLVAAAALILGPASREANATGPALARFLPALGSAEVDAEVLGVSVVPKAGGGRAVIVEFRTDERITISLRVIRYQSVIARTKLFKVRPGRWILTRALAADIGAGRARASVRLEDRAGHVAWYGQPIRIPAPGRGASS